MNEFKEAIYTFLNKLGYLENPDIEGVIFYGSSATGYNTDKSDIDLLIIRNNNQVNELYKGTELINSQRIEYFEKPLSDIYTRADKDFKNQSNVLLSMVGHGVVIFDRNGEIAALQKYILELYSQPLMGISEESAQEKITVLSGRINALEDLLKNNDPYFMHLFHLRLEELRIFYHKLYGYAELSAAKVYRIYTDTTGYREKIFKNIPDQRFIDLYLKCITETNLAEKMCTLLELYCYSTRDIHLDPLKYRIRIQSRN